jgi:2-polyprenyl-3-methyl-5-hydroxy-6-metoxy-1,4-benzoquinol methylase
MKRVPGCPLCGGVTLLPFAADRFGDQLHFAQARCVDCRLVISQPQASQSEMNEYYQHQYYEEHWSDAPALWLLNTSRHERVTLPALKRLWSEWIRPGGRVLEVGCGYGAMLEVLRVEGFDPIGIDPSLRAVSFCRTRGLRVMVGAAPNLPFGDALFDLVIARHVIEHVSMPPAFVSELARLIRPGGLLVFETENIWTSQYTWDRVRAFVTARIPPFRSSTDHTFVFAAAHLEQLLLQAGGCTEVRTHVFNEAPAHESLHWRLYKGTFRQIDRVTGCGEYLLAVGRKSAPPA